MNRKVSVIIVTHNSEKFLPDCLDALERQTSAISEVIIVDCASQNKEYLKKNLRNLTLRIFEEENIGFAKANNFGVKALSYSDSHVIFLNPDTFLRPTFVEKSLEILDGHQDVGILSGKLLGFDIDTNTPTTLLDSAGIFRSFYGRWFDRGQGEEDRGQYDKTEFVPALCGALMVCSNEMLHDMGQNIFDPDFFLYKEDIELSIRVKKKGWKLLYHHGLTAYHCRGWNVSRRKVDYKLREMSAKNEILLYKKHPSPYILWALLKKLFVVVGKL